MLLTHPTSFVDISSLLYEQPHNINVTLSCSFNEWSEQTKLERKNTMRRYSNKLSIFSFCNANL